VFSLSLSPGPFSALGFATFFFFGLRFVKPNRLVIGWCFCLYVIAYRIVIGMAWVVRHVVKCALIKHVMIVYLPGHLQCPQFGKYGHKKMCILIISTISCKQILILPDFEGAPMILEKLVISRAFRGKSVHFWNQSFPSESKKCVQGFPNPVRVLRLSQYLTCT
jgi:hypothetical protein